MSISSTANVRDFPSIQAAIDSLPPWGGTVLIPAGLYQLTETLYLPCDRPCQLIGEGRHDFVNRGTVLEWTTNVGMLRVRGDFSSVRNLMLRNISGGQASREDEGYGISIGRRNRVDPHPHPEPITTSAATEYARGGHKPLNTVLIEDVLILDSPGWGIHVPGVGRLSDEATAEYDRVLPTIVEGGTFSFSLEFRRTRVRSPEKYGGCFVGTGCTLTHFVGCSFIGQSEDETANSNYFVYLGSCDQPVFDRCLFEGLSPTDKAWIRLFATSDAVFDCCWFENDYPGENAPAPKYFLELDDDSGNPCRGGSIRHCRFIRSPGNGGHMSILQLQPGGSAGFHIVGAGGVSVDPAWSTTSHAYAGPPHFDLGGDSNVGTVMNGTPLFRDVSASRQFQIGSPPRAASFSSRSLGRLPGATTAQLFDVTSDDPSMRLDGNLVMNWNLPGDDQAVGCPMYKWGGTSSAPKWRLVNNAPSLTASQRDARTNWVQGDMILLVPATGEPQLQVRLDSGWKTVV